MKRVIEPALKLFLRSDFVFLEHFITITVTKNRFDITTHFQQWAHHNTKTRPDREKWSAFLNSATQKSVKSVDTSGAGTAFPHFFHVFIFSVMKANISLNSDLKMSVRSC